MIAPWHLGQAHLFHMQRSGASRNAVIFQQEVARKSKENNTGKIYAAIFDHQHSALRNTVIMNS